MSPSLVFASDKREFATEIKFLVDAATAERIRAWSRERLSADPHAGGDHGDTYRVTSVYYDTPDLAIFHRRSWLRYSKFRVRHYDTGITFLERKLKVADHVAKRRSPLASHETLQPEALPEHARWFVEKTAARRLHPVCQINYRRTARVALLPSGPIRLTLDDVISAVTTNEPRCRDSAPGVCLTDHVILELKFRRDMPVLFRELAASFTLNPRPFSKYRAAVQTLGLAPDSTHRTSSAIAPDAASLSCPSF